MKRIISYNVNGIRAALSKGLMDWLKSANPDIVCFQELKASPDQFDDTLFEKAGYHHFWYPAVKKGYSGVGILSRIKPTHVEYGTGIKVSDDEGRVIRADFGDWSVMSVYVPSGTTGDVRQDFKMQWLASFDKYLLKLKKKHPNLIIAGDVNICHKPIDIHDPIGNKNSSGFLPGEREWLDQFIQNGMVDAFRKFNQDPHQYSWWSFRANARNNNKGWRIDYQLVSEQLSKSLKRSILLPEVKHSDHCPVLVDTDL